MPKRYTLDLTMDSPLRGTHRVRANKGTYSQTGQSATLTYNQSSGLDSRAGDEAALETLYASTNGGTAWTETGWGASMDLSQSIAGVTVETINSELRVTSIDTRLFGMTGNINFTEWENLKECTLVNVTFNSLNSQIPQELVDLPKLEHFYLCTGDPDDLDYATNHPHEIAEGGGSGDVHPGKNKGRENNVITGTLHAPTSPATSSIKWLVCNWTDTDDTSTDGLSGIDSDWSNVSGMVGLHIHENRNVDEHLDASTFLANVANMNNLDQFAMGTEKAGNDLGPLNGSVPNDFGTNLSNLRHLRWGQNDNLSIDYDTFDATGLTSLRTWAAGIIQITGSLSSEFVDGTIPNLLVLGAGFPQGGTPGVQGAFPAVAAGMNIKVFQFRNNSLTSLPASLWQNCTSIIQPEFTGNSLTTLGTDDFTGQSQLRYLRVSGNELHENIPYLNWSSHDAISGGVEFQNNRYVFKHLLYVPPNAPAGETVLGLWQDISNNDVTYAPQKTFGSQSNYDSGTSTIDFSSIVSHADNVYSWTRNGSTLSGETSNTLDVSSYNAGDEFVCSVTNSGASALTLNSETITI